MKRIKKIFIGCLVSVPMISNAQFNLGINPDGRTNNNIRSIGIGSFTNFNRPQANLHVNQLLMPNSPFFGVGNLFRTDGNSTVNNNWQLFTGATNATLTEKFRLFVPANSDDAVSSTIQNGAMMFNTNSIERVHINADNGLTDGFIGMGNGFNNPQSHLHINNPTNQETWMQITNNITGQTPIDGLRIGMFDNNAGLLSFIRWHERSPIIFQTLGSTISSNEINNGERIRISAIGAPTDNPDPFNVQGNETRIGISHNSLSIGAASKPITRIRSLLHLGYNTGAIAGNLNLNDGWRSWMDVGTFTGNGREHMYFGFKQEVEGGVIGLLPEYSHYEAIINWGDNELNPTNSGKYTNLRFVYTTPQIGIVNTPQSQVDGLETMRIEPTVASTLTAPNFGMVGIGDFSPEGPNTAGADVVNAKLDIDGDLRIRTVTQDNALTQILAIDPNDHNRVHWIDGSNLGGGIGNYCADPQNALTNDYEIALDGANYYFSKQGDFTNAVGIGLPCGTPISFARLQVLQTSRNPLFNPGINIAGQFNNTAGGSISVGVFGDATTNGSQNIGGYFSANGGSNNFGIYCTAPVVPANIGNYPNNLALFADGDSYVSGIPFIAQPAQLISDQQFKTNIQPINNAIAIINQLQPRIFNYNENSRIHFQSGIQYGLIAQEVEPFLPHLVLESVIPAEFDSLGNIINPAIPYKSLNYNAFIAILMKGMQEQQVNIDSLKNTIQQQDSINNDLHTRLTYLESCIRNANICEESNRIINQNTTTETNKKSIELINTNSIILDQNLPNPFAEHTVINYNIPTDVTEAKLLFYDLNGRIIKELIIEERGESKLTVYGTNLKTGVYTYSLIADGELIATKKMVKK